MSEEHRTKLNAVAITALVVVAGVVLYNMGFLDEVVNILRGVHEPVLIESNQDFLTQGWPGNGTTTNPYVISGIAVNPVENKPCIDIRNTTASFTIKDCYLISNFYRPAIRMNAVQNALVQNCFISITKGKGIEAVNVSNSNFIKNSISGFVNTSSEVVKLTSADGIYGFRGFNNEFSDNRLSNLYQHGIRLSHMDHCTVANNMISNSRIGVFLYNGWYCDIEYNEIFNSGHGGSLAIGNNGIEIYAGAFLSVRNNLIHHNAGYGIQTSAWRSAITNNTIHDNELGGIFSEGSSFISITGCIVANNGGDGVAFKGWSYFHAGNCIIETSYIHHNVGSGIYFYCVDDGEAHDNRIEFNGEWGIYMLECLNTTESNNVFDSNTLGDVSP